MVDYSSQLLDLIESGRVSLSDLKPSDWAEQNIVMPKPFPGPLRYDKTPYTREIIDCFAKDHPAREIAVMGAAQFGKTASIIVPVIGYIIANDPGNIIMTVGHEDLIGEAMDKIDAMLDSTGLRKLIRPSAQRAKSQKTGDTNTIKQFPNGYLKLSAASNPKIWRQVDYKFGLIDDYEPVRAGTKQAGNTRDLIEKRFTAYNKTKKILYVSSPELKQGSNILEVYLMGDQRKFMIPCPCCGDFIELKWSTEGKNGDPAGITWKLCEDNRLDNDSVGYICQSCGDFFTDQYKSDFVTKGFWKPTAIPVRPEFYSYHMSSLYSPHGMSDWKHYVNKWLECNPIGGKRIEKKYQTFLNLDLGEPYEETGEVIKASQLQMNTRNYEIGIIPEKLSIADGNGKIILLTFASDMNGTLEDARLDWEVKAWSETGSCYSIEHGSIGTFVPRENQMKFKEDRERWTYEHNQNKSVWPEVEKLMAKEWASDSGRSFKIFIGGLDTGHCKVQAYTYIDKTNFNIFGLKGDKESVYRRFGIDLPFFKPARERDKLFIVEVGQVKDRLSEFIRLKYDEFNDDIQPPGFINFPVPAKGLYQYKNFFSHYEAEQRIVETNENGEVASIWKKKDTVVQNHMWDVGVYGLVLKELSAYLVGKYEGNTKLSWRDLADRFSGRNL